ncbi:MAG: lysostaphin resistance A-like protein [Xenococcaceae cyanobacterium]
MSFQTIAPVSMIQVTEFFLVWTACWLPLAIGCAIAIKWRPSQPITSGQKLPLLASLYAIAPLILWQASQFLAVSFTDWGFTWNWHLLISSGGGFVIGAIGITSLFAGQIALGWVKWQQSEPKKSRQIASVVLLTLLLAVWISGTEELIFRGFIFTQLERDFYLGWAAAISSLIFALLHLVWEQKETLPQLPGLWLMGMVLVLARWVDNGSLGLAWGLHAGWVWAIACLDTLQIVDYTGNAAEWVTGKHGKPLAGVVGLLFLLATCTIIWLYRIFYA